VTRPDITVAEVAGLCTRCAGWYRRGERLIDGECRRCQDKSADLDRLAAGLAASGTR
jgi:hypothetical protein